jgi:hypothetical protein
MTIPRRPTAGCFSQTKLLGDLLRQSNPAISFPPFNLAAAMIVRRAAD